jgi:outer membrane protein assembly factor BamB
MAGVATWAQTGAKLWETPLEGGISGSPAIGSDGSVYVGTTEGRILGLTSSGQVRWVFATQDAVVSSPALGSGDVVYVGCRDHRLYAFQPTGTNLWSFATGGPIETSPAVGLDGTVYIGSDDGYLHAVDDGGRERWRFPMGDAVRLSPSIADNGMIVAGNRKGGLVALSPQGVVLWKFDAGSELSDSLAFGTKREVVLTCRNGLVYSLSAEGRKLWEFKAQDTISAAPVVAADGTIYALDQGRRLYSLSPAGSNRWASVVTGNILGSAPALAADGTIFLANTDGVLWAYRADGTVRWSLSLGTPIARSSPTLLPDGTLYIGSDTAKLIAVRAIMGAASGPWPMKRRDWRNTASGFVARALPPQYVPGASLTVTLRASPPAGTRLYVVEEQPPAGWIVDQASCGGFFDSASKRVKFGPFPDDLPRDLTYSCTPPLTEAGSKTFGGTTSIAGQDRLIGGDQVMDILIAHPADLKPVDQSLAIHEVVAYGYLWKRGQNNPVGPNPIPTAYVTHAADLWLSGEYYRLDTNVLTAPWWWTPASRPGDPLPRPPATTDSGPANGVVTCTLPQLVTPNTPFTVELAVTFVTNVLVQAVEENLPDGIVVLAVDQGGALDTVQRKLKWGPFFDGQPRKLTYRVTLAPQPPLVIQFSGAGAFDTSVRAIGGDRRCALDVPANYSQLSVNAALPEGFSLWIEPGGAEVLRLEASTNLVNWVQLEEWKPAITVTNWIDSASTSFDQRFYRLLWP